MSEQERANVGDTIIIISEVGGLGEYTTGDRYTVVRVEDRYVVVKELDMPVLHQEYAIFKSDKVVHPFAVGDRVKLVNNDYKSVNEIGDVGEVTEVIDVLQVLRVQVDGGSNTGNWSTFDDVRHFAYEFVEGISKDSEWGYYDDIQDEGDLHVTVEFDQEVLKTFLEEVKRLNAMVDSYKDRVYNMEEAIKELITDEPVHIKKGDTVRVIETGYNRKNTAHRPGDVGIALQDGLNNETILTNVDGLEQFSYVEKVGG